MVVKFAVFVACVEDDFVILEGFEDFKEAQKKYNLFSRIKNSACFLIEILDYFESYFKYLQPEVLSKLRYEIIAK